jgi:trimeric autotransporter adhesin
MPSTYTTNLGIQKIASGEQTGTWGDSTNTNWDLVDEAINGFVAVSLPAVGTSGAPNDIPITDGASSTGRNKFIQFTSASDLGGTAYVRLTPNDAEKIVHIRNSLLGGRQIIIFQGTYNAANDFVIPNGADVLLRFDGAGAGAVVSDVFTNLTPTGMTIGTITATTYVGLPAASDTVAGIIEIATAAEANTGTDNVRAVSPLALEGWTGSAALNTFGTISTIDINGGTIDGTAIGGSTASTGNFSTLSIGGTAITATAAEINIIDGVTATTAELNYNDITTLGTAQASKVLTVSGTSTMTLAGITTANLGTVTTADINGGTIDGTTIGGAAAAAGTFTTLTATTYVGLPAASTTVTGIIEIADQTEVNAGASTTLAVTPSTLANYSGLGGSSDLNALTDVTITTPADNHVLQYNNGTTQWVNRTLATAGIAPTASPTFTGTISFSGATISNLGTVTTADINGGTIDGTAIGGSTASTATFTTVGATTYTGLPTASTTASGIIEIATAAEGNTGTDNVRAMSPLALATWAGNTSITKLGTIATGVWNGSVIAEAYLQNQSGTNTGDEPDASTTVKGIIEIADQTEVNAGLSTTLAVTPATLAAYSGLGSGNLNALSDVTITTVADLHVLQYDNGTTQWVNRTLSAAGIAPTASPTFTGTVTSTGTWNLNTATLTFTNTTTSFAGATISNLGTVTTADINGGTIDGTSIGSGTASTGNFSTLSIGGTAITATASELNILDGVTASFAELNYTDITTLGVAEASKALTVSGTSTINMSSFATTNVNIDSGAIDGTPIGAGTASTGNFSTLSIGGTAITSTAAELNILDGVTASFTELNYNDITTLGTAQTSKVLTVSGSSTINLNSYATTNVNIDSGAIDGTNIGATTAGTGRFSTLTTTGATTFGAEVIETAGTLTQSAATITIDPAGGTIQTLTLSQSVTTVTNNLASGESITLRIADGTAYTITWGASVTWIGGSAPTLATTGYTWVALWNVGGTNYGVLTGTSA